jgi:hypothetical protein
MRWVIGWSILVILIFGTGVTALIAYDRWIVPRVNSVRQRLSSRSHIVINRLLFRSLCTCALLSLMSGLLAVVFIVTSSDLSRVFGPFALGAGAITLLLLVLGVVLYGDNFLERQESTSAGDEELKEK